jgi:hypothetical protein
MEEERCTNFILPKIIANSEKKKIHKVTFIFNMLRRGGQPRLLNNVLVITFSIDV